jgi:hypothetical protein
MLAFAVSDFSGQLWFQSFNDSAEVIMGLPADELHERRVRISLCLPSATSP